MSPFNFESVQCLDLQSDDTPQIDVKDGRLILTAQRGGERIIITSPLSGLVSPAVAKTAIKAPKRQAQLKMVVGKRRNQGARNPIAKLSEESVREIRELAKDAFLSGKHSSKMKLYEELGSAYGVNKYTIKNVVERLSWTHI